MRKYIIGICVILILALTVYIGVEGIKIGQFEILGISNIKEKNENLDEILKKATKLASTDFQQKQDELKNATKELKNTKEEYEDTLATMTNNQIKSGIKIENTIDFLYVRIENHAKSEGVSLNMEITKKTKTELQSGYGYICDINFTATGSYTGIEEFITDIEDDSKLGFTIENFAMVASNNSGEQVEATFVCRDIIITELEENSSNSTEMIDSSNTINTNTTSSNNTTNSNTNNTTETKNNTTKSNNTVN